MGATESKPEPASDAVAVESPAKTKVVVVGAGPSGLVALKEFRHAGFDAVCYEKDPGVGGAFRLAYENMFLTISNRLMGYSDFPDPAPLEYSTRERYVEYLECYATLFGLNPHIHFNTTVTGAKLDAEGRWEITMEQGGKPIMVTADRLLVATGSNHTPKLAPTPGYTGRVIHSSDWRGATNNEQVAGKRVLVVGSSESAADISADSAEVAKSVTLWARRAVPIGPRFLSPKSNDELASMKNQPNDPTKVYELLESITVNQVANLENCYDYSRERIQLFRDLSSSKEKDTLNLIGKINLNACSSVPAGLQRSDQVFAVPKTTRGAGAVAAGKVDLFIAKKAAFDGKKVTFSHFSQRNFDWPVPYKHREEIEADVIVMCTGFKTDFEWLDIDIDWNARTWFKNCIPPGYEDKLAFLGWTRPHQGAIPACSEMLARYLVLLYTGKKTLPDDWRERIEAEKRVAEQYYIEAPGYNTVVDYPSFMWAMARLIGCEPRRPSIFSWKRFVQYYTFPQWPCFFRQRGPDARPEMMAYCLDQHGTWESIAPWPVAIGGWRALRRAIFNVVALNPIYYALSLLGVTEKDMGKGWFRLKSKKFVGLHGVNMKAGDILHP